MVRQCVVCRKIDYLNPNLSFHCFPVSHARRNTWMELLGFQPDKKLPKRPEVCSDHFEKNDFTLRANGTKILRRDAVPYLSIRGSRLLIMEATSLNASQNVLPTIVRDEFYIKQEPNDLYLENIPSSIEQHENASPNFDECKVYIKKELNGDNKEQPEQHLKCSTIKKKKQRKLNKCAKKINSIGGIIVCEVCGNMFTKQVEFFWHFSTSHRFKGRKLYKTKIKQKQISNTKTKISCKTIPIDRNIVVKEEIEIVEHELKEESQEADQLKNVDDFKSCFNENGINKHIKTENCDVHKQEKLIKCGVCSKSFLHKSKFDIHMRCHTGEKPFKCDICLKSFSQKYNFNVHLRKHKGETPFKCEVCSKSFREKGTLVRHMRCHTGEKPFKCEICLKSFRHKGSLTIHMRCHTGEKPFECEICLKSFRVKDFLNRHMRCHTGEKPYKCEVCSKYFKDKRSLNKHIRCQHKDEK